MDDLNKVKTNPLIDEPIDASSEDILGRAPIAHAFAHSIRTLDTSHGLVVGILGRWGVGKSSFVNLMREQFEVDPALTVVDFNPWMFSGTDQLVSFFFSEIGEELRVANKNAFAQAADWLDKFAGVLRPISQLMPIPGAALWSEIFASSVKGVSETTNADRSVCVIRRRLIEELSALESPLIVIIDDIDRLSASEVRDIFKLVRLTANFPNVVYVLVFDRERVECALAEHGESGREYLDKIVQLSFDVPQIPKASLRSRVFDELEQVLVPLSDAHLNSGRWSDVYSKIVDPLLSTMRDVARFTLSAKTAIVELGDEIDLVDLLAMEAIRVFRPNLFHRLTRLREELANTIRLAHSEQGRDVESMLVAEFPGNSDIIHALIRHVFPAVNLSLSDGRYDSRCVSSWRTDHRVAHPDFLSLYFDRVAPEELLAFLDSEPAFQLLEDSDSLIRHLSELPSEKVLTVISNLASYEAKFTPGMVVPGSTALLNLAGFFFEKRKDRKADLAQTGAVISGVVCRLLRVVDDGDKRQGLVSTIMSQVDTYSSQLFLIDVVSRSECATSALVSTSFSECLRKGLINRLEEAPPCFPEREWDAWRVYNVIQKRTGRAPLRADSDPVLLHAVLRSLSEGSKLRFSSEFSNRSRSQSQVFWDAFVPLFESRSEVVNALDNIESALGCDDFLQRAYEYLSG